MSANPNLARLAALNHDSHIAALDYRNRIYKAHHKRGEFHRAPDIHWCRLGDGAFNIVYAANVPQDKADALIERVNREVETWNETARWFAFDVRFAARSGRAVEGKWLGVLVQMAGNDVGFNAIMPRN